MAHFPPSQSARWVWKAIVTVKRAEFVAQRKDVGKNRGITEESGGDIRIERRGKGERWDKNLVVELLGFKRGMGPADAAIQRSRRRLRFE
jgi:hypothetical protein